MVDSDPASAEDGPVDDPPNDGSDDASGTEGDAATGSGRATAGGVPTGTPAADPEEGDGEDLAALRERVEQKYDFEDFGPADMAEMSAEEWEAAFDPETWITGPELLDRLEDDLLARVADREVFARIERHRNPERLLAYSDEGYALVYPDGTIEGRGTVLRDVEPVVALCSMDSYDVADPPAGDPLPSPREVPEGGSELGNRVLQVVAAAQVLAGLAMLVGAVVSPGGFPGGDLGSVAVVVVAGLGFLVVGVLLFGVVANARLSEKFRAEEYRQRLRAVGLEDGERPEFVPELEGGEE